MFKYWIALSLVACAFYEALLYFIIPGRSYPSMPDMRITKDFVALASSLAIGLYVLYHHGLKPMKNVWLGAFMVFLVFNLFKIPNASISLQGVNVNGMWNGFPAFQIMVYFFLFIGMASAPEIHCETVKKVIFSTVAWSGFAMACYMILQALSLDQIMTTYDKSIVLATKNPAIAGTLGQPTLCAPFLVMCLPFMLNTEKRVMAVITMFGVFLSGSAVAIMSMASIFILFLLYKLKNHRTLLCAGAMFGALYLLCSFVWFKRLDFFCDNGRFAIWEKTLEDFAQSLNSVFTGAGVGSYKFLFALKNGNTWFQAHNDYLQLLFTCGIIGVFLVGMFLKTMAEKTLKTLNQETFTLSLAFISVLICACGTFVFQLGVYQFYSVIILGMIYNLTREVQDA